LNHHAQFPLRVPRKFLAKMRRCDAGDPLLKQVLPLGCELDNVVGFSHDPLQELTSLKVPGLLHKYHGRVLVTLTGACGIHCRYCFRRHFPYQDNLATPNNWNKILDYIAHDDSINEVIFSGGDPLVLSDAKLAKFCKDLSFIPHLRLLRIHSRLPVIIPERIGGDLIDSLALSDLKIILVTHCNHANEIDDELAKVVGMLKTNDITVFNQSVLLKGVNDSVTALVDLSEKLFECGIIPYYLHVLDRVAGAAHFYVSDEIAKDLHWEVVNKLPGYLVPKLVREVSGVGAKVPL